LVALEFSGLLYAPLGVINAENLHPKHYSRFAFAGLWWSVSSSWSTPPTWL